MSCELCSATGSTAWIEVAADDRLRILRVLDAPDYPAFYRVVWRTHVAEFTDLSLPDRLYCMEAVAGVEQVLREALAPTKINLASLGNAVPHLHWHVIARFADDSHFPQPIWGVRQRDPAPPAGERLAKPMRMVDQSVQAMLAGLPARLVRIGSSAHPTPAP
ncbi:HIT family protein [Ideonella sp. YS5]|uniref:HIT family protein n=1 Tax=Ideonella sp. YS5 TaxID=3453714 RepID=UPI003EE8FFFC